MTEDTRPIEADNQNTNGPPKTRIALTIDWDLYGQFLDGSDLSDAEKREFIETLWFVAVSFVDLGFGIHPLQQATEDCCEEKRDLANFIAAESRSVVNSQDISNAHFKVASEQSDAGKE